MAAVVGLGGYASVPMARAAARRRVPLVLLEQNAVPGKATRWLARRAALICTAFDANAASAALPLPRARDRQSRSATGFFEGGGGERRGGAELL